MITDYHFLIDTLESALEFLLEEFVVLIEVIGENRMVRQLRLGLERGFRWRLLARLQVLGGRVLVIGVGVLLDLGVQHILKQSCRVHYHFDVQLFRCN